MPTQQQLDGALRVIVNLVRTIALKRAIATVDPDPHLNFWRVIQGNNMDMAAIEWCKLFGSDDEEHQQVHWKNVFDDHDAFRAGLLQYIGVDPEGWATYWRQVKEYRDQNVAHRDLNRRSVAEFPVLDNALRSSAFYYRRLLDELHPDEANRYPADLMEYYERFLDLSREVAERALGCTHEIRERVR